MRSGPNKRSRGRNNNNPNNPNQQHNNGGRPRVPHRSQTFDTNGPAGRFRGNAYQVFERYVAAAREAVASGDRVSAENCYQHAEHYFRIMNANGDNPAQQMNRQAAPVEQDGEQQPETEGAEMQPQIAQPVAEQEVPTEA